MAKATFHTSFGKVIPFVEGYRELHRPPTTQRSRGSSKSDPVAQVGFGGFLKDLFEYALVMDFLGSLGIRGRGSQPLTSEEPRDSYPAL